MASQPGALSAFALNIACYTSIREISLFRPAPSNESETKLPSSVSIELTFIRAIWAKSSSKFLFIDTLEYNEE